MTVARATFKQKASFALQTGHFTFISPFSASKLAEANENNILKTAMFLKTQKRARAYEH
jgi:hypothetical protein